jgi:hypothetical protein
MLIDISNNSKDGNHKEEYCEDNGCIIKKPLRASFGAVLYAASPQSGGQSASFLLD